jgi:hypothetical protein
MEAGSNSSIVALRVVGGDEKGTQCITASVQLKNKITGRESQGACGQDELIGGKQPVIM